MLRGRGRFEDGVWVARGELILARDDKLPLRELPLDPDPLTGVAVAMAQARPDQSEDVEVVVDLAPLTAGDRRRRRRRAVAADRGDASGVRALLGEISPADLAAAAGVGGRRSPRTTGGQASPSSPMGWLANQERLIEARAVRDKVFGVDPAFWLQLLIRTQSAVEDRHVALLQAVVTAFEGWGGENYFRQVGVRLGPFFWGSDSWLYRRSFDRRWRTGLHRRRRRQMTSSVEIGGLLKPPTRRCPATNVARSGGVIPPPPRRLPTYAGQPELLPLGRIDTETGTRAVGVPLEDAKFGYTAGRQGSGKTASALARAIALFRSGHGGLYLDPHDDAVQQLKEFVGDRANVWHLDLCTPGLDRQAAWNLFDMTGGGPADIESKVSAVIASFSAALSWDEQRAPRALTLVQMAAQALCELALRLPGRLAPTIFQMVSLLDDDDWRSAVLPYLSPHTRGFFATRFGRLDGQAITPVTNLIDRMRASPRAAALLGASRSTYDVRRAMDTGQIVLWSTPADAAWTSLMTSFVVYDLFRAAMSRQALHPDRRRLFWAWIDEAQRITGTGSGKAGETVAHMLEEVRKMGLRVHLMSQQPTRLAKPTLDAIMTNRQLLCTHLVGADSAKIIAKEWGDAVDPTTITRLPNHQFIAQVTLAGQPSPPFLVHGFNIDTDQPWVHWRRPGLARRLERRIDANLRRRPVADTLAELDTLDERIVVALEANHRPARTATDRGDGADPFDPLPPRRTRRGSGQQLIVLDDAPADSRPDDVGVLDPASGDPDNGEGDAGGGDE